MRLVWWCVCVVLLACLMSVWSEGDPEGSCPVRLRAVGGCRPEDDDCSVTLALPKLTLTLPPQWVQLERGLKELRSAVAQLQRCCGGAPDQAQHDQPGEAHSPGDTPQTPRGDTPQTPDATRPLAEMQQKLSRVTTSLRNARVQISVLQGQVGQLTNQSAHFLEAAAAASRVQNATCSTHCPSHSAPQFMVVPRDCSEYSLLGQRSDGIYKVTPDPRNGTFSVWCDMESYGGGWTVIQRRLNGSVSFNRSWAEYKRGFGDPRAELWLGNDLLHLLTKAKDMVLRIELEDMGGVREYAKYERFYVANELLRYRLSVSGYSGSAGDALHFSKHFNHDQKFFSTPDRDNDMYPSGNCGAYYSSGWWFDACMSANLNGKYYHKRYQGVRNGIFWGTWANLTREYYPTSYRQAFRTVKMMIRPKNYAP
ncbi:fibrinogen-like 2a [Alosa pseudoharengus]|uniref:fibrinogen-like 2a n=1 Tax=Alosa pseudoharengus TaxID=34774 RepID=UPI003F8A0504